MADSPDDIPSFEELLADPEIAALLDFAPVPRRQKKEGGWSAQMQRIFIARLARHGSPGKACDEMGMYRSGIDKVFKTPIGAESFREAWAAAVELAERRHAERVAAGRASVANLRMPFVDNRRKFPAAASRAGDCDAHSGCPRCAEAERADTMRYLRERQDGIRRTRSKLFKARRAYLLSIADDAERRAAWELLCGPADWAAARTLGEQPDEDPDRADLGELRGPGLQIPITTGFAPELTEPANDPEGDPLAQLEQSVAKNDPRWNGIYGSAETEEEEDEGE